MAYHLRKERKCSQKKKAEEIYASSASSQSIRMDLISYGVDGKTTMLTTPSIAQNYWMEDSS